MRLAAAPALLASLLLLTQLPRASVGGDVCNAAAHVGCSGGRDLVPLKTAPKVQTAAECCALCKKMAPNCTAWTWNGPGGNLMCYPKTACTRTQHGGCCETSGSAKPLPAPPPTPPPPPPPAPRPPPPTPPYPFKDHSLPWAKRVANLVSLMNVSEKVDILQTHAPAIPRLAVRGYSFETECDSGICGGSGGSIFYGACGGPCSTDNVTAFPQSIGMGQTWNTTLERAKGNVIGVELRSIAAANRPDFDAVYGLSCFSPMMNIIRDPFWGRNNEGYSECPHLTGEMAHAVVTGMQGDDERYLQIVAGCKHFVPYDGKASSTASDYDLFSTYLPGFKRCMEAEGPAWKGAMNIMCSYTEQDYAGSNSCTNSRILDAVLKQRYNFSGFVISDLGAVDGHTAASIAAGMDVYLGSGPNGREVKSWLASGLLTQARLDDAVSRTLLPRFMEGEFDPVEMVPYWDTTKYGCDKVGAPEHHRLAYEAAVQSLVLLRNDGVLPLPKTSKVAIIGPFGTHARWMFNRYSHVPAPGSPLLVSVAQAMASALGSDQVTSAAGCSDVATTTACLKLDTAAVAAAEKNADVLVFALGTGEPIESETSNGSNGPAGATLVLPGEQEALIEAGLKTGKKVIVVLFTASPKNGPWMSKVHAVVHAAYPQMFGAKAVTDVLLGDAAFSGKLATTWPKHWSCNASYPVPKHAPRWSPSECETLPGRLLDSNVTYRYGAASNVLYPFGYGLSYGSFEYSGLKHVARVGPCGSIDVTVTVANSAEVAAPEVVQVFLQWGSTAAPTPELQLVGFEKVWVAAGGEATATVTLLPRHFAVLVGASTTSSSFLDCPSGVATKEGCNATLHATPPTWEVQPLTLTLHVGGQQPALGAAAGARAPSNVLTSTVTVTGAKTPLAQCPGGTPS